MITGVLLDTPARDERHQTAADGRSVTPDAWQQGRVALHLRLGITGHRSISKNDTTVADAVCHRLDQVEERRRTGTAATPADLTVVCALAEGADRLVAWQAIQRGASLEVVLPLPVDDYLADFESEASRAEFHTLLAKAAAVTELGQAGTREKAYERAGRAVVDRSDIMLALWDGRPARGRGGTAEIVSYAQKQNVPVVRIAAARPGDGPPRSSPLDGQGVPEAIGPLSEDAFRWLDRFNSGSLRRWDTGWPAVAMEPVRKRLRPHVGHIRSREPVLVPPGLVATAPPRVQHYVGYAQPFFHRAEAIARSKQRVFLRGSQRLYILACLAVIVVATQIIFENKNFEIVWGEVGALVLVVAILVFGWRGRWHDRWLAARYLTERIRCGVFIAATGARDGRRPVGYGRPQSDLVELDPNQEWVERAFDEINWRTSRYPPAESEVPALRKLLTDAWIDDQIEYHKRTSRRLAKRQRLLTRLAIGLFAVSAIVALFHSIHLREPHAGVWGYLGVIIPAMGAAASGYGAQRQYARLAERSRLMVSRLYEARDLVEHAARLSSLQRATRKAELLMHSEMTDWYAVLRLHDFEVPP